MEKCAEALHLLLQLGIVYLSGNRLSGTLPSSWAKLTQASCAAYAVTYQPHQGANLGWSTCAKGGGIACIDCSRMLSIRLTMCTVFSVSYHILRHLKKLCTQVHLGDSVVCYALSSNKL